MSSKTSEKGGDAISPAPVRSSGSIDAVKLGESDDAFEVFKKQEGQVDFRTVSAHETSLPLGRLYCDYQLLTIDNIGELDTRIRHFLEG